MSNLSLETIAAGAAQELFEDSLKEVVANIHDINCDAKAVRKLTLTFTFKPNERDRSSCVIAVKATPQLAPRTEFVTDLRLGLDDTGKIEIGYQSKNRRIEELLNRKEKISTELRRVTDGDQDAKKYMYRTIKKNAEETAAQIIGEVFEEDAQ